METSYKYINGSISGRAGGIVTIHWFTVNFTNSFFREYLYQSATWKLEHAITHTYALSDIILNTVWHASQDLGTWTSVESLMP